MEIIMEYKYYSNDDLEKLIVSWEADFGELIEIREIGKSFQNRPLWMVVLTNKLSGKDTDKPAVWIDANIHATEITGTTAALAVAYKLLDSYTKDKSIRRLLDNYVYYIVPRINPDGADLALSDNPKFLRSGVRTYPYTDKEEGLHIQDIDQDGRILQMRIPDPNGDWKIHPDYPELMIKRAPDELDGTYYRIYSEGILEDYDGVLIKTPRPLEGLDFNRNFPFEWKPESDQIGAGPYPGSEPEIKSLLDFIISHPNINFALTFHTFGRVILRPFSTKADTEMDTSDLWIFEKIGEIGTDLTGYRCASTFHDFLYHPKEVTTGAFDDWMYDHLGIFAYTVEFWDLPSQAGVEERKFIEWFRKHPLEDDIKIYQWIKENTGDSGYINWYEFAHPQLGNIELGGWNTFFTWRNPPVKLLQDEVQRIVPFAVSLGNMLPHVSIKSLDVHNLSKDMYSINLVLENTGFLATYTSNQGKNRKATRPIRIELEVNGSFEIVKGKQKSTYGHLEGRSKRLSVTAAGAESPTDNRLHSEWVIKGKSGDKIVLHITTERAGNITKPITL